MNARLHGFLSFLDLLAEGQRRQAESITGRRFQAEAELAVGDAPRRSSSFP